MPEPVITENLYATLRESFAGRLDAVFLRLPDGSIVTYRDIDDLSARVAAVLDDRGIVAGDRLVAQIGKSPLAVALYLGCLGVGAVYVPLNDGYTNDEVGYFVADARPSLVVGIPGRDLPVGDAPLLTLDDAGAGSLADLVAAVAPLAELAPRAGETAAMLYTSGTTGKPKGAMLTTENLASNAAALTSLWGFTADDVLVHALPIFHVHGLFIALHCAMSSGSEVRFLPKFDVAAVRRELRSATVMMGVPTFYSRLLADPDFGADDCESMRLFVSGSAPLTESVHHAFTARTGHHILERYGMTETGMITSNPLVGERIAGTVGYALPGVEIRVTDEHGVPWTTGTVDPEGVGSENVGTVEVRGPNVFSGYWGMPDKTAASFRRDGWFVTGDLGSMSSDGRLTLSGRGTDLIISGGLNIYPKEIELLLDDIAGVVESAVIGVPHPDLGDGVVAVVVAAADVDPATVPASIAAALDGRLARFKHPKHVAVVADLPRNAMGKVEKAALRRTYAHVFSGTVFDR
ncbi:MAG: Acyl-CoA synthetase (AMP-forming)/AMP-acid ligase [Ilumatobacteraceae bacterium]|nr:Acyl-CoA synthetase (AMP-forming)/AMP-acid ligase [Ilumatobacteraceae bacterium]